MLHPLAVDASELTDSELDKKVQELSKKLMMANRMGNYELIQQVQMLLNDYQEAQRTRERKQLEETLRDNDSDFDDIIDVG
jgi:gamma-glutamyl:cysteine ligase YbdK (ATP-grasp superfamily)